MTIIEFITAFGIGAIVSVCVQSWLSHKSDISKRNFHEKREAYLGYLDALYLSEIEKNYESALNIGRWQNRIELVGSKLVINYCQRISETNSVDDDVHPERPQALKNLKEAMRQDLGVDF